MFIHSLYLLWNANLAAYIIYITHPKNPATYFVFCFSTTSNRGARFDLGSSSNMIVDSSISACCCWASSNKPSLDAFNGAVFELVKMSIASALQVDDDSLAASFNMAATSSSNVVHFRSSSPHRPPPSLVACRCSSLNRINALKSSSRVVVASSPVYKYSNNDPNVAAFNGVIDDGKVTGIVGLQLPL